MAGTKESDGLYLMALFWALKNERSPIVYRALVHDTLIETGAWRISSVRDGLDRSLHDRNALPHLLLAPHEMSNGECLDRFIGSLSISCASDTIRSD